MSRCLLPSLGVLMLATSMAAAAEPDDPNLWLEEVTGEKPLDWVKLRNAESMAELTESDSFRSLNERLLKILDSDARIPFVSKAGDYYYNFWRDAKNKRGLWRRTTLEEYRKEKPAWETVLDLDALAERRRRIGSGKVPVSSSRRTTVACCRSRAAGPTPR